MKSQLIFNEIIKKQGNFHTARCARDIISRLNIDNNSRFEIHKIAKDGCNIKLFNKNITCDLAVSNNKYNFSYKMSNSIETISIHNINLNELKSFLKNSNLLNDMRVAVMDELQEDKNTQDSLLENTIKIFDILDEKLLDKPFDYFINSEKEPFGIVICCFNKQKLIIQGDGLYELYPGNDVQYTSKKQKIRKMKFDELETKLIKNGLAKTRQCSYEDASLYILEI